MGENSKIEWTDHTFNPWIGCTKVSPGCAHCYAEILDKNRFSKTLGGASKDSPVSHWGKGAPRLRTSESNWRKPLKWNREYEEDQASYNREISTGHLTEMLESPVRPRVFCSSLADWLDDEVPIAWLADLLKLIHDTPNLTWQLLTKRPENWKARIEQCISYFAEDAFYSSNEEAGRVSVWLNRWIHGERNDVFGRPPENIWIGTTVEDQKRADERIPALLKIPAKVRFLSCEPLLGPVEFSNVMNRSDCIAALGKPALHGIDWVICGGESGPGARPMHQDWARSLRDQCQAVGVPFLFKQWGEHLPVGQEPGANGFGEMTAPMYRGTRVGKKAAGRVLDGREWNEFPKV